MKYKEILNIFLMAILISNLFHISNIEAATKTTKNIVPISKNYTFNGLDSNVTIKGIYSKGKYYIPILDICKKLDTNIISKKSNIIVEYGISKIIFNLNGKVTVDNVKLKKFNSTIKKINNKLYISTDSFNKILKEINSPIETDASKVIYLKNNLPISDYNYNLNIIHKGNLPYWEWDDLDKKYLSKLEYKVSKTNKEVLTKEIFILDQCKRNWEQQYSTINNFNYYPSTTIGVIDTLYRAIIARKNLISSNFDYPKLGSSFNGLDLTMEDTLNKTKYIDCIKEDLKLIKVLNEIPFDTSVYKDFKVLRNPYIVKSSGGFALITNSIEISNLYSPNVFYHELGHVWANLYLHQIYDEYVQIRGKDIVVETGSWGVLTSENFAEDFSVVMSPYHIKSFLTSYGYPSEEIMQKLKDFILNKEKNKFINKTIKINNKYVFDNIYTTTNDTLTISGKEDKSFSITIKNPNFEEEDITINPTNNMYSKDFKFDEEGLYCISGFFGGSYYVYYNKDILSKKLELSYENDLSWQKLHAEDISDDTKYWLLDKNGYSGYWVKELSDSLLVTISEGNENGEIKKYIQLVNVELNENETVIEVAPGNEKSILLKLPLSAENKPIVVKGLQNNHLSDSDTNNFIVKDLSYKKLLKGEDLFAIIDTKVKNSDGNLYYEVISDNKVVYNKKIKLDCSSLHWSSVTDVVTINATDIKDRVDFLFYTDETKKIKLGATYVTISE